MVVQSPTASGGYAYKISTLILENSTFRHLHRVRMCSLKKASVRAGCGKAKFVFVST